MDNFQIKIMEGEFFKPTIKDSAFYGGDTISMIFKNKGEDTYVLSGRKHSFDAIRLKRGTEEKIDIKSNSFKLNEFGFAKTPRQANIGKRRFETILYEPIQGLKVKKVEIDTKDEKRIVTLITEDGEKHQLPVRRSTTYDDSDKLSPKYWLSLI